MKLNQRLRRERELRGWSQAKVADEVGTDPATVSRWERGLSFPYPYFREKLCALFGKNAEELGLVQEDASEQQVSSARYEQHPSSALHRPLYDPAIPLPSTVGVGLVGRDTMLSQLKERLSSGSSVALTALNGLPGVGKTALAVQLAHDSAVREHFRDGVLWAGLGPAPSVLGQLSRWGTLLGIASTELLNKSSSEAWAEAIRAAIGTRNMLLVIDDAWELEEALAFKVGGPNCALLVTTRFPHIALHFAADGATIVEELSEDDGVALLERLVPDIDLIEPVAAQELVRLVGGLPLALTLMGRYLRVQAHSRQPRRILAAVERLRNAQERLQLSEPYALVERHSSLSQGASLSLQSVIAVSDLLLDDLAQMALRALAVFPAKPNSFSEDAAVAVCDLPREVLDTLTDAGLLESRGPDRYTLHQTIADYALLRLSETGPYQRLVEYFVSYVEKHRKDYNELEKESQNILAAFHIAYERNMQTLLVRGVNAFADFLLARALYTLAEQHLQRTYQAALALGNSYDVATTLLNLGKTVEWSGDYALAGEYLQRGLSIAQQIGCGIQIGSLLHALGEIARRSENDAQAEAYLQEGLKLARQIEHPGLISQFLASLGRVITMRGDYAQAEVYLQEGLSIARRLGQHETVISLLMTLGKSAFERGNFVAGEAYDQEALALARQLGHCTPICRLLVNLGAAACECGHYEQAEDYLQEGLALARQLRYYEVICLALANLGCMARERGNDAGAEAYLQEGLELARQQHSFWYISLLSSERGELYLKQQRASEAVAAFREMLANIPEGSQELRAVGQYGLARAAAAQGDLAEARQQGEACLAFFEISGHRFAAQARSWLDALPIE